MPRVADIVLALVAVVVLALPMAVVALLVKLTSPGPIFHWSNRIGQDNRLFAMPKFRSMRIDTPAVATHLLADGQSWLTPIGGFLRHSSFDELPQLWCILTGRMSIVGPRPALFNQDDLIEERCRHGVNRLRPGLTGWAQVNGRDRLSITEKVMLDTQYLELRSGRLDMKIIWMTIIKVITGNGVAH
ncbi:sugar transferase [Sphingomonas sp.]|uniref:sugar transferase n=1 Tax=Sphingomonas sp. TaxID=28214 RepID=UPI0035BC0C08